MGSPPARAVTVTLFLCLVAAACGQTQATPAGCLEAPRPGAELFPDKFELRHAESLTLSYHGTYKVMTLRVPDPFKVHASSRTYVLVQCGTPAPELAGDLAGATVVEVPVRTVFSESASHLGFMDVLGVADRVSGVSSGQFVGIPSVRERVDAGAVVSFSPAGQLDTELVVAEDPDVFVSGGFDDPAHDALRAAGIPVVANAEWLETTPLGWAEWIAFFAALTNTEARAAEVYAGIEERYLAAAELADAVTDRPTVITGGLFEGTWVARGGASITPRFIADAGGAYVYADDPSTGPLMLDIETVLVDAVDADVWISPSSFTSEAEAIAADERYGRFAAWDRGGVWDATLRADPASGANPYFDQGPVKIDEVLLDYVKILHPELVPDHEFAFFEQLPAA